MAAPLRDILRMNLTNCVGIFRLTKFYSGWKMLMHCSHVVNPTMKDNASDTDYIYIWLPVLGNLTI